MQLLLLTMVYIVLRKMYALFLKNKNVENFCRMEFVKKRGFFPSKLRSLYSHIKLKLLLYFKRVFECY